MSMRATAISPRGAIRQEIDVNGRHTIVTDEPEHLGGSDTAPAPHELLAAMVASCVSTMMAMYANSRGWDIGDMRVDVDYDNESTPRGLEISVQLPPGLDEDQVARLRRVADTCPVKRALESGFTFEQSFSVGAPPELAVA